MGPCLRQRFSGFTANIRILIGSLAAVGADEEARAAAAKLMSLEPGFTLSRYEQTLLPYHHPDIRARFLAFLRWAGLPGMTEQANPGNPSSA